MAAKTVTVRIGVEADRLARACAGLAGKTKPAWIAGAIERAARADYPEVVERLARNRKGQPQQPPRGGNREE